MSDQPEPTLDHHTHIHLNDDGTLTTTSPDGTKTTQPAPEVTWLGPVMDPYGEPW